MNQPALTPDETKRMQNDLKRDPQYTKSRNSLLWVSVLCVVFLAFVGLLVMFDRVSFTAATIGITGCIMVYFYSMIRVVKMRNAAESRWVHGQATKRENKKERKKNR